MPPDITPGGGATLKDAAIVSDREANLARITQAIGLVEAESLQLKGRPDGHLKFTDETGTYWTLQVQRGLISGQEGMPSLTATLSPRTKDGLPPFEIIRADVIQMFGTRLGGIHLYPRTGKRSWNEQADIAGITGLVDTYSSSKPSLNVGKTVSWAANVVRTELRDATEAHIGKYLVGCDPNSDRVMIRELDGKNGTKKLITSDPGSPESPDGTPARPPRIIVQDLHEGTITFDPDITRPQLRRVLRKVFPNHSKRPTIDNF